jgi:hypothetical protein
MSLRLSEAIRLGAMLKPKGYDGLLVDGRTCALGAALDAIGQCNGDSEAEYQTAKEAWPLLMKEATSPVEANYRTYLQHAIWQLNDSRGWTRERIADWVETIEREHEPKPAPMPVGVEVAR